MPEQDVQETTEEVVDIQEAEVSVAETLHEPAAESPAPQLEGATAYKAKAFAGTSAQLLYEGRRARLLVEVTVVGIHKDLNKDGRWVKTAILEENWTKVLKVFLPDPTLFDQEPRPEPAHVYTAVAEPDESGEGKIWKVTCKCGEFSDEAAEEWEADVKGRAHVKEALQLEPPPDPGLEARIEEHQLTCDDCEPSHPCPVVFRMREEVGAVAEPPAARDDVEAPDPED